MNFFNHCLSLGIKIMFQFVVHIEISLWIRYTRPKYILYKQFLNPQREYSKEIIKDIIEAQLFLAMMFLNKCGWFVMTKEL